jgi:hypothetical protein
VGAEIFVCLPLSLCIWYLFAQTEAIIEMDDPNRLLWASQLSPQTLAGFKEN